MTLTNGTTPKAGQTLSIIGCGMKKKQEQTLRHAPFTSLTYPGTMASAILSAILESCAATQAAGSEPRFSRFVATCNSTTTAKSLECRFAAHADRFAVWRGENVEAMKVADVVMLSFKPYMIDLVLRNEGVREALAGKLVLSVLAGSPVAKIENAIYFSGPRAENEKPFYIKRAMMNLAAEYRESMTVIESTDMPSEYEELSNWVFLQIGKIAPIAPELYDVGGVLAGASGALMSVAFDGMLDAAVSQGLKRADAKKILTQSLVSLAKLLENEHPAVLREKFSSPKGTTIAGLLSLEEDRARYAYTRAVNASSERSKEIGK
jgi:pyrroline-5-carboxylate reductase